MMKRITVLGNFSGRNAGDAAILGNLLNDISTVYPETEFLVPTINTKFVKKNFGQYNIKAVGLYPWKGAVKILGIPTFRSMINTDLVLITDNILFDLKLYNPLFNYLNTISLFAPSCNKRNIPIVIYNASLGPINSEKGKIKLQQILDACPLLILRDTQSKQMLERLKFQFNEVHLAADCALNTIPPNSGRMEQIILQENLFKNDQTIGFNVNSYIDKWLTDDNHINKEKFLQIIAATLDKIISELNVEILFFVTQVMDSRITKECLSHVKQRDKVKVVSNLNYTYEEIAGLLAKVELHVGMRTHSLILSAAVSTPMVSITSYPKSEGFMCSIKQQDWMINLDNLTIEKLTSLILSAWNQRDQTRKNLASIVKTEKEKAKKSVELINNLVNF